jgi:putative ABC transport system permease protein
MTDLGKAVWRVGRSGLAISIVVTLAIGVAAVTTAFSVVYGVLLRPLPFPKPTDLVQLLASNQRLGGQAAAGNSIPDYFDLREQSHSFERLALHLTLDFNLPGEGSQVALPVRVTFASSELFAVLGESPVLGRAFAHAEERPGEDLYTVVLSHQLWQRRFAGDPAVIGRIIRLDTTPYRVVGVMPARFRFPVNSDAWAPIESWFDRFKRTLRDTNRDSRSSAIIGRLRPGVHADAVPADLNAIAGRLETTYPLSNLGVRFHATPLRELYVGDIRPYLGPLLGAAAFVLLIACINVTQLLAGRAVDRRKEIAVRIALGIGRGRLVRNLLTESLWLSALASAIGLAVAAVAGRLLESFISVSVPSWMTFNVDWRVAAFAIIVALLAGLPAGLVPALQMVNVDHARALADDTRGASRGRGSRRRQDALVALQGAVALVLLVGGGLMFRTVLNLEHVDLGIRPDRLLVVYVSPPGDKYRPEPPLPSYASLYNRAIERLRLLPGVEAVAGSRVIPYDGAREAGPGAPLIVDGRDERSQNDRVLVRSTTIAADYFAVAGIGLVHGQTFSGRETLDSPRVAIVSRSLANRLWPSDTALGKRIKPGSAAAASPWHTIVGVAGDVKYSGLHTNADLTVYYSYSQVTAGDFHFLIRTHGAPLDAVPAVQREFAAIDPDLALYSLRTMESIVSNSLWRQRLWGTVLGIFAAAALLMAVVGMYSVVTWSVRRREQEMSIRLALGAQRRSIIFLVVRHGMTLTVVGIAAGLAATAVATQSLSSVLFGVGRTDPPTLIGMSLVLGTVSFLACLAPAQRAATAELQKVLK